MIVGANGESNPVPGAQDERTRNALLEAVDLLVHGGRLELDTSAFAADHERAAFQVKLLCAREFELRQREIGPRGNLEVVFEITLVSIEHEIDAGINVVVADAGK